MGRRLFFAAALLAIFGLQLGDCMAAMGADQASMQCCRTMPCTPANHDQPCCKHMVSASDPAMLPGYHLSLHAPTVAVTQYPAIAEILDNSPEPSLVVQAQQHSPPNLYTLHVCLLI